MHSHVELCNSVELLQTLAAVVLQVCGDVITGDPEEWRKLQRVDHKEDAGPQDGLCLRMVKEILSYKVSFFHYYFKLFFLFFASASKILCDDDHDHDDLPTS